MNLETDRIAGLIIATLGLVLLFVIFPVAIEDIEGQYIGLMRFHGAGMDVLRKTGRTLGDIPRDWMDRRPVERAYMTDLLMEMILRGHRVSAAPVDGGWMEIDTPDDYALAAALFAGEGEFPWFAPQGVARP